MNNKTLEAIAEELKNEMTGQKFGRIFVLSKLRFAVDFRLAGGKFLFIGIEPAAPRVYLIERRLKELEKQTLNLSPFFLYLRKKLSHAVVRSVEKIPGERILSLELDASDELGRMQKYFLIVQLTGRSANLFLLDENRVVLDALRENSGEGQQTSDVYMPPARPANANPERPDEEVFPRGDCATLSEALDAHYQNLEAEKNFLARAGSAEAKVRQEIKRRENLVKKLKQDLENHGDAEKWKRFGDLILANLSTAERRGGKIIVTDYFDESLPKIEIEAEENLSLTEAAERYFKRYTKARNAKEEITKRLAVLKTELEDLYAKRAEIERAVRERDEDFFKADEPESEQKTKRSGKKTPDVKSKARTFLSSDGFEILVGKGAKDNDHLTFRVARSNDLWLHAADYPGSHVVVKGRNREEIPQKTLIEAAQLAAFYSQAREESKVAVHYTLKKFVHKPKGAPPGLVNLASFKTIMVEPKIVSSEQKEVSGKR
jgi:predicted ribosome quality control (RQC) complex YloA/Tae2 family protein